MLLGTPIGVTLFGGFFHPSLTFSFLAGMAAARLSARPEPLTVLSRREWVAVTGTVTPRGPAHSGTAESLVQHRLSPGMCGRSGDGGSLRFYGIHPTISWSPAPLQLPPLRAVGAVSYSLFLVHEPILEYASLAMRHFHLTGAARMAAIAATVLLVTGATLLLYYFVEKPIVERLKREKEARQ